MNGSDRQFTDEERSKALAARKAAVPKGIIAKAVKEFCLDCTGVNPSVTDCQGNSLLDGTSCELYCVNTALKRRKTTKTTLRRAIRRNCLHCLGGSSTDGCTSPNCNLYVFRTGKPSQDMTS